MMMMVMMMIMIFTNNVRNHVVRAFTPTTVNYCGTSSISSLTRPLLLRHNMVKPQTSQRALALHLVPRTKTYYHTLTSQLVYQKLHDWNLYMSTVDEDEDEEIITKRTVESDWNISGMKKEIDRLILRAHKKIGKANQRLQKAQEIVDQLTSDPNVTLEELEKCPDVDALQIELRQLQERLKGLNILNEGLSKINSSNKNKNIVLPIKLAEIAIELNVNDKPPQRPQRGPTKPKGPRSKSSTRKPYRRYYSYNNIEIRVGKKAEDNDQLTLSTKHRNDNDWWMHASGCPGSHVVIRCTDEQLPEQVIYDAAALAARQSKCNGTVIPVSLTRCRDIRKPPGAKPGLVMLTGNVQKIKVNMKEAQTRLDRLEETVKIN